MERLCHVFRVAPGMEDEYVRRHVDTEDLHLD